MAKVSADVVHLRASGVSLVISLAGRRLPQVVHWGADLGDLDEAALDALVAASAEPRIPGELDDRYPVALLPEHSWGWMHTPGLAGHRDGRDHSTRFDVATVDLAAEGTGARRVERLRVRASDRIADLALTITIEMLASGLVRARAELESTGNGTAGGPSPAVQSNAVPYTLDSLSLLFPVPREATEILDFAGRWARERTPQRHEFTVGAHLREARRGKPGHDSAFLMAVGPCGFGFRSGEVWATHVAWSGNSRHLAERNNDGTALVGGGELLYPGEVRLLPGESYTSPWVYASYGHGLDEASARIHRYLRSRPDHPSKPRPVIVNTWEAVYFDHSLPTLTGLAEAAAEVGAELFVLDDGWFRGRRNDSAGLGDWFVDEAVYPDGLLPFADYVRSKGMEFGMWVEPEMVNPDSDLARAHPEWIAQASLSGASLRLPLEARHQHVLDLTQPEAYAYIEERLHALVREIRPGYLKWDHNRDLLEAGNTSTGRAIGHAQTLAWYRLVDGLRAAFPGLEIEACAGGGGRIDLEALHHVQRVWASDSNDALERTRVNLYTSLIVPPEMLGAHIGPPMAATSGRMHTLDFRAGTALWGHLGLEWNLASAEAATPEARAALREWVALYKRYRGLLHTGEVVRSDLDVPGRTLHGVVAAHRREALYAYASTDSMSEDPACLLRLEGLDPKRVYRVSPVNPSTPGSTTTREVPAWWEEGVVATGLTLAVHGIQAPSMQPEGVALLRVEAI